MIECRDLTELRGGRTLLDAVSLRIATGERWVLWGANGSGKTTLARSLVGFVAPDGGSVERSELLRPPLPLLFQDPDAQIAAATVRDEVALGAREPGEPRIEAGNPGPAGRRLALALERFELTEFAQRNPHSLSGGEKRRLNLAALSVLGCPLLILDEPELHLDDSAWAAWTKLLDAWHAEGGRALLEICRDPARLPGADGLAVLHDGRLVAAGAPEAVYREVGAMGLPLPRIDVWEAAPLAAYPARAPARRQTEPALWARGLVLERPGGGAPVLAGIDLQLDAGERLLLLGGNGSGKSSLLLVLAGLADPDAGSVVGRTPADRGIAFQEPERLCFAETVRDEVLFGLRRRRVVQAKQLAACADAALARLGLDPAEFGDRDPFTLSAGEMRRLALAAVLALEPDPLLLDEPGAALDAAGLALLRTALAGWHGALIWADCRAPAGFAGFFDRALRLTGGKLVEAEVPR